MEKRNYKYADYKQSLLVVGAYVFCVQVAVAHFGGESWAEEVTVFDAASVGSFHAFVQGLLVWEW